MPSWRLLLTYATEPIKCSTVSLSRPACSMSFPKLPTVGLFPRICALIDGNSELRLCHTQKLKKCSFPGLHGTKPRMPAMVLIPLTQGASSSMTRSESLQGTTISSTNTIPCSGIYLLPRLVCCATLHHRHGMSPFRQLPRNA